MRLIRVTAVLLAVFTAFSAGAAQLKIATMAPDGSFWMTEVKRGADEIEHRTEGRVKLRIYPGGTMGDDQAVLRKMRIGQLHGGMVTGQSLASITSDLQLYGLPLFFRSYAEVDAVRAAMDDTMIKSLQNEGYRSFGLIEGGFAYILSNEPARSLDDFKGQKAWAPEGDDVADTIYEAAGLSPVPLPVSDVLTGLQTGLIDTVGGPPVAAVALQWFTRTKYLTDLPILYTYGSIIVSEKAINTIDPADRAIVQDVLESVSSNLDERTRHDNIEARDALVKQGMTIVTVPADEEDHWNQVAATATRRLEEKGRVPKALLQQARSHLETFRKDQDGS